MGKVEKKAVRNLYPEYLNMDFTERLKGSSGNTIPGFKRYPVKPLTVLRSTGFTKWPRIGDLFLFDERHGVLIGSILGTMGEWRRAAILKQKDGTGYEEGGTLTQITSFSQNPKFGKITTIFLERYFPTVDTSTGDKLHGR